MKRDVHSPTSAPSAVDPVLAELAGLADAGSAISDARTDSLEVGNPGGPPPGGAMGAWVPTKKSWVSRNRVWVAGIAAAVVIAGGATWYVLATNDAPAAETTYTTETAEKGTLSVTVDGTGNVAVRDEVDASPAVSGEVASIKVAVGDSVSEGDVLYTLTSSSVDQAVASAKTSVQQATNQVKQATLSVTQAKAALTQVKAKLAAAEPGVSATDVSNAEMQVEIALGNLSVAKSSLSAANTTYSDAAGSRSDLAVTAPCDGTVWSVNVAVGDSVSAGSSSSASGGSAAAGATGSTGTTTSTSASSSTAPVTIARDGQMGVELSVNEVDVTQLKVGQDVQVTFDAIDDLNMVGTVDEIATEGTVSSGVVSYSVWVVLQGTDPDLKVGMSASATVVTAVERDALLVSSSAVQSATDGTYYVQVMADGATTPTNRTVEVGLSSSTQTVITSGISAGDTVVVSTSTAGDSASTSSSSSSDSGSSGGLSMMTGGPSGGQGAPPGGF